MARYTMEEVNIEDLYQIEKILELAMDVRSYDAKTGIYENGWHKFSQTKKNHT